MREERTKKMDGGGGGGGRFRDGVKVQMRSNMDNNDVTHPTSAKLTLATANISMLISERKKNSQH